MRKSIVAVVYSAESLVGDGVAAILRASGMLVAAVTNSESKLAEAAKQLEPEIVVCVGEVPQSLHGLGLPAIAADIGMTGSELVETVKNAVGAPVVREGAEAGLSARETSVAALIAAGFSNRDIAQKLRITEQTVKNMVSKILKKRGYANRVQIAMESWGGSFSHPSKPDSPSRL